MSLPSVANLFVTRVTTQLSAPMHGRLPRLYWSLTKFGEISITDIEKSPVPPRKLSALNSFPVFLPHGLFSVGSRFSARKIQTCSAKARRCSGSPMAAGHWQSESSVGLTKRRIRYCSSTCLPWMYHSERQLPCFCLKKVPWSESQTRTFIFPCCFLKTARSSP